MNPAAVALADLLGRSDKYGKFSGNWCRVPGDTAKAVDGHLRGDYVLGPLRGGEHEMATFVMAWDDDEHRAGQDAKLAYDALRVELARLRFMPPIVATSKGGAGYHVYCLFSEPVATGRAHRLAKYVTNRIHLNASAEASKAADCTFPGQPTGDGIVLALPWHGLLGTPRYAAPGGSRFVHPHTLVPYPDDEQVQALLGWPRSTLELFERAWSIAEIGNEQPAARPALRVIYDAERQLSTAEGDLETLRHHCEFIQFAESSPAELSYDQWLGLGTVLKAFSGGDSLFDSISRHDAERYRSGEPDRKLKSIRGKPRHCNTIWSCTKRGVCASLGVQSPAGLPFKLTAAVNKAARQARKGGRR